jgi:hypothetical protein
MKNSKSTDKWQNNTGAGHSLRTADALFKCWPALTQTAHDAAQKTSARRINANSFIIKPFGLSRMVIWSPAWLVEERADGNCFCS